MAVSIYWDDDGKSILQVHLVEMFMVSEFPDLLDQIKDHLDEVNHTVYIILNVQTLLEPPYKILSAMPEVANSPALNHVNLGGIVGVMNDDPESEPPLGLHFLASQGRGKITYSMEEAHRIIEEWKV